MHKTKHRNKRCQTTTQPVTMIQVESINTTPFMQNSTSSWMNGPHVLSPPAAPRGRVRTLPVGLMDNLEKLSAPSLSFGPPSKRLRPSPTFNKPKSQELFNDALKRMRQGAALRKLQEQRDETARREELATTRMQELGLSSPQQNEKNFTGSPRVALGRRPPARSNSGVARSA